MTGVSFMQNKICFTPLLLDVILWGTLGQGLGNRK